MFNDITIDMVMNRMDVECPNWMIAWADSTDLKDIVEYQSNGRDWRPMMRERLQSRVHLVTRSLFKVINYSE